jgi:type VI secretion system secreted protein VgrG
MLQAMRHDRQVYTGESQASGLACGFKLSVAEHSLGRLNAEYLITGAFHSITSDSYRSGRGAGGEQPFNIRFEAIPAATPFRLPRTTPRPQVEGLESAIVSGPEGEDIFVDEYGRVKIRFHWDRADTPGEKSTCWVRVAQFGGLGNVVLPRVGQEVMVDFMHGNPDYPIVCGWVFNNALKPVYNLPEHKTRSVWRTKRYRETGQYPNAEPLDTREPGANELRFEDLGGKEEVFLHAERDMNTRIRFEETHHVGAAQTIKVGYDRTDTVGRDETTHIKRHQTLTVDENQTETIGANRTVTVTDIDKLTVTDRQEINVTNTIKITSGTGIKLICGASTVEILPGQVKISSPIVTTAATGTNTVKGKVVEVNGSGMIKEKGGIITLN